MNRWRQRCYAAVLALCAIAVLLAGARTLAAPDYSSASRADRVVVVGVPALGWEAISPSATPHLWQLAEEGAVGLSTARAARSVTCPWDGWLTLGAGNRARYPATIPEDELPPAPDEPLPGEQADPDPPADPQTPEEQRQEEATEGCLNQRGIVPTVKGSKIAPAITENDKLRFGAKPGALGQSVRCTTVVGDAPVLAAAGKDADVRVADRQSTAEQWAALIEPCPLTLIATADAFDRSDEQMQALDLAIFQIVSGAKQMGATVIVAGISQPEYRSARLHAIIASGPGLNKQLLSSPSTGRAPYSQLIDIAPTVLSVLGEDAPASMTGQVLRGQPRTEPLDEQVTEFRQESVAALAHVGMANRFFPIFTWIVALATIALAAAVHWRRPGRWARPLGTIVALLPAASLAANLYPWWTAQRPAVAIVIAGLIAWAALGAIALLGPWRRAPSGPFLAASAMSCLLLAGDVLTGSHLQLNSPLGYDAIVAGRFTGFGNITYAVYAAAGLVALAAATTLTASSRAKGLLIAIAGLALIAVDGAPGAGADFGGVIALVPALLLMWMIICRIRMSRGKLLLVTASGIAVVTLIAVADYLRPAQSRTHLGRFVGQVLDGTAWTVVERKLEANLRVLTGSVLSMLALILLAVVIWQWRARRSAGRRYLLARAPEGVAGFVGVLTMAVVAFAANDSGIAIIAAALAVCVPPLLGILADDRGAGDSTEDPAVDAARTAPS